MRNLKDPFWMWVKAVLLAVIAVVSGAVVWMKVGGWEVPLLLGLLVWSSCRVHYFFFHVLERWVEPGGRFRGIGELMARAWNRRQAWGSRDGGWTCRSGMGTERHGTGRGSIPTPKPEPSEL